MAAVMPSAIWTSQIDALRRDGARIQRLGSLPPGARVAAMAAEHNRETIFAIVRNIGCLYIKDISEATGLSRDTVAKHLGDLASEGRVRKIKTRQWVVFNGCNEGREQREHPSRLES